MTWYLLTDIIQSVRSGIAPLWLGTLFLGLGFLLNAQNVPRLLDLLSLLYQRFDQFKLPLISGRGPRHFVPKHLKRVHAHMA